MDSLRYLNDFAPHYSRDAERLKRHGGEFTIFGAPQEGLKYDYSDHLANWDRDKSARSYAAAVEKYPLSPPPYKKVSVELVQEYLSLYFGEPVEVMHIVSGVNMSNGYPYQVFGYRVTSDDAST